MKVVDSLEQKLGQLKHLVINLFFFLGTSLFVIGQEEKIDSVMAITYKEISSFNSKKEVFFCYLVTKNTIETIYQDDDINHYKLLNTLNSVKEKMGKNYLFLTIAISGTSEFYFKKRKTVKIMENCIFYIQDNSISGPIWFKELLITPPIK